MKTLPCIGLALIFASAQLNYSATIGSIVWNDLNGNGIRDTNEPGVDAVTLELFSCVNSNLLGTQITTNGGTFQFSGTLSTQVFLKITLPDGYKVTAADQGTDDLIDSDVDPDTLRTPCITLDCTNAQGTNCLQTFWNVGLVQECTNVLAGPGFWKTHSEAWPVTNITIGGSNYMSSNAWTLMANGRDKSLTLFRALLATRLNILAGNESSCITQAVAQAEEWLQENPRGSEVAGSSDAWKEGAEIVEQLEAYNEGELCARCRHPEDDDDDDDDGDDDDDDDRQGTIGNLVWNDLNGNGIQDSNEPGIDAVTVQLFSCVNSNLVGTQLTSNGGNFLFSGAFSNDVFLKVTLPSGYTATVANQGTNDLRDSDVDPATLRTPCITLDCTNAQGTNCLQTFWDIGLRREDGGGDRHGTIGNLVWNDLNGNGIQDTNEPGIDAVTVQLFSCVNSNLLGTQLTTNGGSFLFSGAFSNQVFLRLTLPDGYTVTDANRGTNDLMDSDVDPATLRTPCITLDCTNAQGTNCLQTFWDIGLVQDCTNVLAGPGFWKTHPEAWPMTNITIGGSNYMSSNALSLLANGRDKSLTLFRAVLTTRLNILAGNESSCITQAVAQAEAWVVENPRGSNVRGSSDAWREASEIMEQLEAYNEGELCGGCRQNDDDDDDDDGDDDGEDDGDNDNGKGNKPPKVEVRGKGHAKHEQRKEDKLRLRIISEPGQIFTVERSTNLSNWVAVATVTNQFGIHEYLSDLTPETNVFYRVIVSGETAGTDEPLNVFGTFKEVGDDEEVELLPIVYDGDLVIKGDNNEISGAAPGETVIAGNLVIKGSDNVVSDLTVLGDVIFQGDDNSLDDVDHKGDVSDSGTGNDL